MVWDPKIQFLSIAPFRDNIRRAIERDMPTALEWAAAQCGLDVAPPNFQGVFYSRARRSENTVLIMTTLGGDTEIVGAGYHEGKSLLLEVETIAPTSDDLIQALEPYLLAVKSIVTEMPSWEFTVGVSQRSDLVVNVTSERYAERKYEGEKEYRQVGSVVAMLSYLELVG